MLSLFRQCFSGWRERIIARPEYGVKRFLKKFFCDVISTAKLENSRDNIAHRVLELLLTLLNLLVIVHVVLV